MKGRALAGALLAAALATTAGCTGSGASSEKKEAKAVDDPDKVSGTIEVITHRTDLVEDGTMDEYAAEFRRTYPNVKVEFDGVTDYEGEVKTRMNSDDYGDVLMIPGTVKKNDYPRFFASLGKQTERSRKFRFTDYSTVDGEVYGLSIYGSIPGFVYNKRVWEEAGVTDWPTTPAEFLDGLKAVKDRTDAVPYYTNFKDGWPLAQWWPAHSSASCDEQADVQVVEGDPFAEGGTVRTVDTLLYDIVDRGLAEKDPTTTNWEGSKPKIAKGEVATMFLGSWAVVQMRDAAEQAGADPDDIGFMPFPHQVDGTFCAGLSPDYQQAVSIHSEHKEAARAWVDWFAEKSGYAEDNMNVSTLRDAPLPGVLAEYEKRNVELMELDQSRGAEMKELDDASEVGIDDPDYRQELVDIARGARDGSPDKLFADLSERWTGAAEELGYR
ncbi:ABC transporter substrate-binding protein [Streptomyces synnematoformans]